MSQPLKLKYLFVAEFTDGSFLMQDLKDASAIEPQTRSQFYDVLQSGKTVRKFSLVGAKNTVSVDLETGLFTVNGFTILLESKKLPTMPEKFDLIFYRQRTENLNVTYDKGTREITDMGSSDSFCEYFIGWQCTINGKNYQQKLAVS